MAAEDSELRCELPIDHSLAEANLARRAEAFCFRRLSSERNHRAAERVKECKGQNWGEVNTAEGRKDATKSV